MSECKSFLSLTIFLLGTIVKASQDDTIINTKNGPIRGRIANSLGNRTFYAFQQIPYAKPPLDDLRFKAPQPPDNWTEVLDCTKNTKICFQVPIDSSSESEDCLYLNVYTPINPRSNARLPILFYIHGGGFIFGVGIYHDLGPDFLIQYDVVVVTINYRLGPFGFLSTGDLILPGNNGLKDQNFALKWVKKNIHFFGGDPNKVTIIGPSSGGASVTYHILSKQSEGLFRGAITQSGSVLCPWAFQRNPRAIAGQLAQLINNSFTSENSKDLLELFQRTDARTLDGASNKFTEYPGNEQIVQGFFFAPVLEAESSNSFLSENMYEAVLNGRFNRVPLLTGIVSEEAVSRAENPWKFKISLENYEKNDSNFVPQDMHAKSNLTKIGKEIKEIYTKGLFQDDLPAAVQYFSDTSFNRGNKKFAELYSKYADVYFYQFSYRGQFGNNFIDVDGTDKVTHEEDQRYLWAMQNRTRIDNIPTSDTETLKQYTTLVTQFAGHLNPTPEASALLNNILWPKMGSSFAYLNINDSLTIEYNPKRLTLDKWDKVFEQYGVRPYETY